MATQALTPTPQTPIEQEANNSVMGLLKKYSGSIKGALPASLNKDRFAWLVMNNIRANPALANCTPASFINAVMLASNMGLEIRRNSAYLIPYGKECQLLVDYRGKMDLARRAGTKAISVELVREFDEFDYERTTSGTKFRHKPRLLQSVGGKLSCFTEAGEVVLGYGIADFGAGEPQIEIMTLAQIETIRRRAKSGCGVPFTHYGKSMAPLTLAEIRTKDAATMGFKDPYRVPWVTDWDQMARKTIMHRLANYIPQSSELVLSQEADESVDNGRSMPVAEQMVDVMLQMDPADNRPMIDIPEDSEGRAQAQLEVVTGKTGIRAFESWPAVAEAFGGDEVNPAIGLQVIVGKKTYARESTDQTWRAQGK